MNGDLYDREINKDPLTFGFIPMSSREKPTMKSRVAGYMQQFDDADAAEDAQKRFMEVLRS